METLRLRLLGPLEVARAAAALPLPRSRKVRALLAYLALAPRPVPRSRLCELLWDAPADPRGELRWCLSKIRNVLGQRVRASGDTVALDLAGCAVDALEVARAAAEGIEQLPLERSRALAALFGGDFLEGLDMDRVPAFDGWLTAQRQRFRAWRAALLEQLARRLPDGEAAAYLEEWRSLAPFDLRVHETLFAAAARRGRVREAEAHLASTERLFRAEGLDSAPLRAAWRLAFTQQRPNVAHEPTIAFEPVRRRGSIAVMPFIDRSAPAPERGGGSAPASRSGTTTSRSCARSSATRASPSPTPTSRGS